MQLCFFLYYTWFNTCTHFLENNSSILANDMLFYYSIEAMLSVLLYCFGKYYQSYTSNYPYMLCSRFCFQITIELIKIFYSKSYAIIWLSCYDFTVNYLRINPINAIVTIYIVLLSVIYAWCVRR